MSFALNVARIVGLHRERDKKTMLVHKVPKKTGSTFLLKTQGDPCHEAVQNPMGEGAGWVTGRSRF